jgi:hypothetical protein
LSAGHDPLPDATIDSIPPAPGGAKGPLTTPVGGGYRSVNVALRKEFELFANVRPAVTVFPGRYDGIDIVMVRENVEGLYSGVEHFIKVGDDPRAVGVSQAIVTRYACERVIRYAFEYAVRHGRKKVAIVHKAKILKMASGTVSRGGSGRRGRIRRPDHVERHDRGQLRHAAGAQAGAVRRDRHHQSLRRHPERRDRRAGGRPGTHRRRQHRRLGGGFRGGARQRARHRGEGSAPIPRRRCWRPR